MSDGHVSTSHFALHTDFKSELKEAFDTVRECRLKVTRRESSEIYIYAEGYDHSADWLWAEVNDGTLKLSFRLSFNFLNSENHYFDASVHFEAVPWLLHVLCSFFAA